MTDYWCAPTVRDLRLGSATFVTAPSLERDVNSSDVAVSLEKIKRKETPVLTVAVILGVLALLLAVAAATGHAPLWVSVVLLSILALLQSLPLGR